MKRLIAAFFMLFFTLSGASAFEVHGDGAVGAYNSYVFRGIEQTTAKPAIQAEINLDAEFIRTGIWATTLDPRNSYEYDTYLEGYATALGQELKGGVIVYNFASQNVPAASTSELYVGVSGDVTDWSKYSVTAYRSNQTRDVWVDVGADVSVVGLTLGVATAYANYDSAVMNDGFEYVSAKATYEIPNIYGDFGVQVSGEVIEPLGDKNIRGTPASRKYVVGGSVLF